jgi:hypothetical protein
MTTESWLRSLYDDVPKKSVILIGLVDYFDLFQERPVASFFLKRKGLKVTFKWGDIPVLQDDKLNQGESLYLTKQDFMKREIDFYEPQLGIRSNPKLDGRK